MVFHTTHKKSRKQRTLEEIAWRQMIKSKQGNVVLCPCANFFFKLNMYVTNIMLFVCVLNFIEFNYQFVIGYKFSVLFSCFHFFGKRSLNPNQITNFIYKLLIELRSQKFIWSHHNSVCINFYIPEMYANCVTHFIAWMTSWFQVFSIVPLAKQFSIVHTIC